LKTYSKLEITNETLLYARYKESDITGQYKFNIQSEHSSKRGNVKYVSE